MVNDKWLITEAGNRRQQVELHYFDNEAIPPLEGVRGMLKRVSYFAKEKNQTVTSCSQLKMQSTDRLNKRQYKYKIMDCFVPRNDEVVETNKLPLL